MNLSSHNFNFHALRNACMDASSPLPTAEELASIPNGYFRLDLSGNPIYKKGNQLLLLEQVLLLDLLQELN